MEMKFHKQNGLNNLKTNKMSKQQTAVEWLFQQLWETPKDKLTWYSILKEVKAMEKEQTLLFSEKYDEYVFRGGSATAEEYYEETFKSE